jgi:putative membrane protein
MTRRPRALARWCFAGTAAQAGAAQAHGLIAVDAPPTRVLPDWNGDPWVLGALALLLAGSAVLLVRGRHAAGGPRLLLAQAGAWLLAGLAAAAALLSPLDGLAERLFSAHALRYQLLASVAAPLLAWALHGRVGRRAGTGASGRRLWPAAALLAGLLHVAALWAWHLPAAFEAGLHDPLWRRLQSLCFFAGGVALWAGVMAQARGQRHAAAMLLLAAAMLPGAALGLLLQQASVLWFPAYAVTAPAFGFDPLQDQQLGGLVLGLPCAAAYLAAGLALAMPRLRAPAPAPSPGLVAR